MNAHRSSLNASASARSGFTLLELSIVLVIVGLIVGSGLSMGKSAIDSANLAATQNRLDAIEKALMAYRLAYNRLPCPASLTTAEGNSAFGNEVSAPGTCAAASYSSASGNAGIAEGGVPVKALSLPDAFAYDGYGRKIVYSVYVPITANNGFLSYGIQQNCGGITINNAAGVARTDDGLYALVSFGKNGHGAYSTSGSRISAGSTNTAEHTNCHCDAAASVTAYGATYVQRDAVQNPTDALNAFDDIVRYKERWQMVSTDDGYSPSGDQTCPGPGIRIDGDYEYGARDLFVSGDVNGDDIPDLIIGSPSDNGVGGDGVGRVYVVFGSHGGFPNPLELSSLDGTNGFRITGNGGEAQYFGSSLATGDINGDGVADIIIGASSSGASVSTGSHGPGMTYVVFGQNDVDWRGIAAYTADNNGATGVIDGTYGVKIPGLASGDISGWSVASGNINGDAFGDIIIGAPGANSNAGRVYVIFGHGGAWDVSLDLALLTDGDTDTLPGFRIDGAAGDWLGMAVAAGKVSGTAHAYEDVIIGAPAADVDSVTNAGIVYVVFGQAGTWSTSPFSVATNIDGSGGGGARIKGVDQNSGFGYHITVGDLNDDDTPDIIASAPRPYWVPFDSGTWGATTGTIGVYVVYGNTSWSDFKVDTLLGATTGFKITDGANAAGGCCPGTGFGRFPMRVGDMNGDGVDDVAIGAVWAMPYGYISVIFGKNTWGDTFDTTALDGTTGFLAHDGVNNASSGRPFVGFVDLNGDGKADLVGGHYEGTPTWAGQHYVYFGQTKASGWTTPFDMSTLCTGDDC